MRNHLKKAAIAAGAAVSALVVNAQAETVDYGAVMNANVGVIDTIWGKIAAIMIGCALVGVGVRFMRKAK